MSNELQATNNTLINPALHQIFTQETPKAEIRTRQGRGGRLLLYTDGAYVIKTLNEAFGWNWDFEADHEEILWIGERPFEARCRGKLVVRAGDVIVTKMQFGSQPIEMLKDGSAPVSLGDAFKGAATDALKKCASLLGIALDLYDSDSEVNTANPQQIQREIQQAKQQQVKPAVIVEQPKQATPANEKPVSELDKHFPRQEQPANGETHKAQRPLSPEQVKTFSTSRDKWTITKAPSEQQATYALTSLSKACDGDDDTRHIVNEFLFGVQSQKELTAGQCSFLIDWCGAKADNDYTVSEDTVKEIRLIVREVVKMAGQIDMFEQP